MVKERLWNIQINQLADVDKVLVNCKPADFKVDEEKEYIEVKTFQKTEGTVGIDVYY